MTATSFPLTLACFHLVSHFLCSLHLPLKEGTSLSGKEQVGHKERHVNTGSSSLQQTTRCLNPCFGLSGALSQNIISFQPLWIFRRAIAPQIPSFTSCSSDSVYLPKEPKACKNIITKPTGHRLHRSVLPRPPRASCRDAYPRKGRQMIYQVHGAVSLNPPQQANFQILWHIGVRTEAVRHGHHPVAMWEAAPMQTNSKIEETLSESTTDSLPRLANPYGLIVCRQPADWML